MSREGRKRWSFNERFIIGREQNPMMERWRIFSTPWFGLYVHFIYREDLDPICHDHPWNFIRFVVKGGYVEQWLADPRSSLPLERVIPRWHISRFPTSEAHRITNVAPGTVSVVLVGRKHRVWGFWEPSGWFAGKPTRRWIDYRDALGLRPSEGITPSLVDHQES